MTTLRGFQRRLKTLNLEKKVPEVIQSTSGTLISLNQKQLFNRGVNTDGEVIGTYSRTTEAISNGRKKAGNHYTLYNIGGFYEGMNIKASNWKVIFDSTDYKTPMLEERLGSNILGLTKESKAYYVNSPGLFRSKIMSYIRGVLKI